MNKQNSAPLDIKFARIKAVTFALRPAPLQENLSALKKRLGPGPGVYSAEPAVLDFSAWADTDLNEHQFELEPYVHALRGAGVNPVEVRGNGEALEAQAEALGLRYEQAGDATTEPDPEPQAELANNTQAIEEPAALPETPVDNDTAVIQAVVNQDQELQQAVEPRRTLVIDQSVRSGQKVYAQGADLIVMGQVSAGAEVIADGNVHVYGVLRGRALAGAAGDMQARIISTCFEAELVAVAGYYLTFEGGFPEENRSKPTLIHLDLGTEPAALRLKAINIR